MPITDTQGSVTERHQHPTGSVRSKGLGFMSGNQQDPDMICEVFVLDPLDLVDDHEATPADGE